MATKKGYAIEVVLSEYEMDDPPSGKPCKRYRLAAHYHGDLGYVEANEVYDKCDAIVNGLREARRSSEEPGR